MKKAFSFLLALVAVCAAVSFTASANQTGRCGQFAGYTLTDAGDLTISGAGTIYDQCFDSRSDLVNVDIRETIKAIGRRSFFACNNLVSLSIADSVTSIGDRAFCTCSKLERVKLGSGVILIDSAAFYGCTRLKSITIPASVTKINNNAFGDCVMLDDAGVTFVCPNASQRLVVGTDVFTTSKMSYSGDSGYQLYDGDNPIDADADLTALNGKTLTWKQSVPGAPSVGVDPPEQPAGKLCKWDNVYHGDSFCGRIIYYFHTVLYFFARLFGIR